MNGTKKLEWWGYLHVDGHIQVKRYFDFEDIVEARSSPFVNKVFLKFQAGSRDEAIEHVKQLILHNENRNQ